MPIRFRCVYCDKLLGIGRRKAGAVVNCPHCGEKLIVPTPESEGPAFSPPAPEAPVPSTEDAAARLFEQDDFDVLLEPQPIPTFRPSPATPPTPRFRDDGIPPKFQDEEPAPPPFQYAVPQQLSPMEFTPALTAPQPLSLPPPARGIHLSRSRLILLGFFGLILLAGAFAGGFLVGQNVHWP